MSHTTSVEKYLQQIEDNVCIITPQKTFKGILAAKIVSISQDFGKNIYSKNRK